MTTLKLSPVYFALLLLLSACNLDTTDNLPPTIDGIPADNVTVGDSYSFIPEADDPDGDPITFSITNKPSWVDFNTTNGELSGAPEQDDIGNYHNILITVSDDEDASSSLSPFSISVEAAQATNTPPEINGTPADHVTVGNNYSFMPEAEDAEGDELAFDIQNAPMWTDFDIDTGELSGVPATGDIGNYSNIIISVTDGTDDAELLPFSITVEAAAPSNTAPTISGNPADSVVAGSDYSFMPTAGDAENDSLTFTITNQPGWANFNTSNGMLSGTPAESDAGDYNNIQISVSDGQANASLTAFSIAVEAPLANIAPTISGTPELKAREGEDYSFTPTATDVDGDALTFSATNLPTWLTLNETNGTISGTPEMLDVDVHEGISITVSDGQAKATLDAFDLTVTTTHAVLNWTPPTTRDDEEGTLLPPEELGGYKIYSGTSQDDLTFLVEIDDETMTSHTIKDLTPSTHYYAITAYDTEGVESKQSNIASKTIE